jgi:hypothetical protein
VNSYKNEKITHVKLQQKKEKNGKKNLKMEEKEKTC